MPLAFYGKRSTRSFWDSHWEDVNIEVAVKNLSGSFLARVMEKYLPKKGKILEGGCGVGQWVLYLKGKGYDIVGVDFAEDTIKRVKQRFPDLPIKNGDILDLPFPDKWFSAYMSLGVIEHFEEGPEKALAEAHRVLQDKGLFLCSVPYSNPIRKLKRKLFKSYHQRKEGEEFYQWAFTKKEIKGLIETAGFRVRRIIPFDASKGIRDEVPGMRSLYRRLRTKFHETEIKVKAQSSRLRIARKGAILVLKWILNCHLIRNLFGHMLFIIAEKSDEPSKS